MNIANITRNVGRILQQNSPAILTAIGAAGVVVTAVSAAKVTPAAVTLVQNESFRREEEWQENEVPVEIITRLDMVKLTWKLYVPTLIIATASIACTVGAQSINARRTAALVSAYSLAEVAHKEWREKAEKYLTKPEQQKIVDEVVEDRMKSSPASEHSGLMVLGAGQILCYDTYSDRYFYSDMQSLRKAVNDLNQACLTDDYRDHNTFNRLIGLKETNEGEVTGWNASHLMNALFTSKLTDDDRPCLAITFLEPPTEKFNRVW